MHIYCWLRVELSVAYKLNSSWLGIAFALFFQLLQSGPIPLAGTPLLSVGLSVCLKIR